MRIASTSAEADDTGAGADAAASGRLDGVAEFLVFAGGEHEARQLQDFVGREAFRDGYREYPTALD